MNNALGRIGNFLDVHLAGRQEIDKEKSHLDPSNDVTFVINKVTGAVSAYRRPNLSRVLKNIFPSIMDKKPADNREISYENWRYTLNRLFPSLNDPALERLSSKINGRSGSVERTLKMSSVLSEVSITTHKASDGETMYKYGFPWIDLPAPPEGVYVNYVEAQANNKKTVYSEMRKCELEYGKYSKNLNFGQEAPEYEVFIGALTEYKINVERSKTALSKYVDMKYLDDFDIYGSGFTNEDVQSVYDKWRMPGRRMQIEGPKFAVIAKYELTLLSIMKLIKELKSEVGDRSEAVTTQSTASEKTDILNTVEWKRRRITTLVELGLSKVEIETAIRIETPIMESIKQNIQEIRKAGGDYDFKWIKAPFGLESPSQGLTE